MDNLRNRYDYYGLYEEKGTYYQVGGNVFSVEDKKTYSYGRSVSSAYTIDFKKIPNPLKIKVFNTGFNINLTDLRGIECLENLELFVGENNACYYGKIEIVEYLLDKGADVNVLNKQGDTPLHGSSFYNGMKIAKLLIDNGADVNIKNKSGNGFLHLAPSKSCSMIKKYIVEKQQQEQEFLVVEEELKIEKIIKWCNDNNYILGKKV